MARIAETSGEGAVADRIRDRRPAGQLRPLDRVLLHSPQVADGWNMLLGTLRSGTSVPPALRELIILRIAVLNEAPYEWASHEGDARAAGLGDAVLATLRHEVPDPTVLTQTHPLAGLVVEATDLMTRKLTVPDAVLDTLHHELGVVQTVEAIVTIAAYNMVSRLVVALGVEEAS